MSTDLERVSLSTTVTSGGPGGRALSANVRKLHNSLNLLLSDPEREQFIHCLNVYHAKRNVFDLVQTLKVILDTADKRRLLPMLRLVIPRSDQLLFDQYTSEGLYLKTELFPNNAAAAAAAAESPGDGGGETLVAGRFASLREQPVASVRPEGFSTAADWTAPPVWNAPSVDWTAPAQEPFGEFRQVTLTRSRSREGLGFSIRGGSEHGVGIYVSLVEPGSSAEREGLRVGDQIVTVNDLVFDRITHIEAVKVLKGSKMLVMSLCSGGRIPVGYITNHIYSWVDPHGRSVSPPPALDEHQLGLELQQTPAPDGSSGSQGPTMNERMVNLNMDDGRSLGLMIRGGAEYGLGIFITGVDPGSAAYIGGLKVGDQLLEVNGRSFVVISHDEAVHILKTGRHLLVRVRDVGRLPHARTAVDETRWMANSPAVAESAAAMPMPMTLSGGASPTPGRAGVASSAASVTRPSSARAPSALVKPVVGRGVGRPGAQVTLEQQAYLLLTEPERQTMVYYLQEYQDGHIRVESLTMALFELFNTHAKLSLLTEVRALVAPQDLELYDELVLNREREAHSALQGGLGVLHPQNHCVHEASAGPVPTAQNDSSHSGRMENDEGVNALQDVALDDVRALGESLPPCPHPSAQRELTMGPSTRLAQPASSLLFTGPTRLFQDCLHRSLKALPQAHQPYMAPGAYPGLSLHPHHTSMGSLHYTCQSSPPLPIASKLHQQPHPLHHHHHPDHHHYHSAGHQNQPSFSVHHTCPGFLHRREPPGSAWQEGPAKLCARSASYERSCAPTRSASSSKTSSPMPSPHPSPCPSPCPSLIMPAPPPCSPDRPCSPALHPRGPVVDINRLSAETRPQSQQRGATLSQLSDSGQTLSEDSGVDIAEAGGMSKDGSPRPSKSQQGPAERQGPHGPTSQVSRQTGSPIPLPTATLVRVEKNANTLGIAIEGGANTRQPLPRIVTIQKGGSAHSCGQLRVGHVILEVNGVPLRGLEHREAARVIAEAFKTKDADHIDFLVAEPGF